MIFQYVKELYIPYFFQLLMNQIHMYHKILCSQSARTIGICWRKILNSRPCEKFPVDFCISALLKAQPSAFFRIKEADFQYKSPLENFQTLVRSSLHTLVMDFLLLSYYIGCNREHGLSAVPSIKLGTPEPKFLQSGRKLTCSQ